MDRDDLEQIIKQAVAETVPKAVAATLKSLGIDASDPIKVQADMQALRQWREASAIAKATILKTSIGVLVSGTIGYALAHWLNLPASHE